MQAIGAFIVGLLATVLPDLVARVLAAVGIGFVSYVGVDLVFSGIRTAFTLQAGTLSAAAIGLLGIYKIGTCFNILMSAYAIRAALAGVTGGAVKRMTTK